MGRLERFLADDPDVPPTSALLCAILVHWTRLYDSDPQERACLAEFIPPMKAKLAEVLELERKLVETSMNLWEAQRAAMNPSTVVGIPPGPPAPWRSCDHRLNWCLLQWDPPETGGPPWGYRVERSTDNRHFVPVEITLTPEVLLLDQPEHVKFYYRVVAFNAFGDGPPGIVFGVMFGPDVAEEDDSPKE